MQIPIIRRSNMKVDGNEYEIQGVKFNYTGSCLLVEDSDTNWRVKFLTSGTLVFHNDIVLDIFGVGGGGSGAGYNSGGTHVGGAGGGGYTSTVRKVLIQAGKEYVLTIGEGGAQVPSATVGNRGGTTTFSTDGGNILIAEGGYGGKVSYAAGGNGGSGGARGTYSTGGVDGGNGTGGDYCGLGQGTTTREFGETTGDLYASGGNSSSVDGNIHAGQPNTGDGGSGSGSATATKIGPAGGSGILVIRKNPQTYFDYGNARLNFLITDGTTQPENPVENTIWVNTEQTIGEWTFSMEQPSSAQDGDIWISTQNSSAIAFDALKENNLMIYPLDAYQYLNNAWVKKPMAIYKNGKWETGDLVLYDGVEWNSDYPYTVSGVTVTQNNGRLQLTGGKSTITFKVVLDLTGYDTIEIDFDGDNYYSSCTHNVIANSTVVVSQVHHYQDTDGDRRIQFSIPIADLTGQHTFEISMWSSNGYTGYLHSLILKKS